jgi:glycosyltransferase involved in cell wall biosynthesis
MQIRLFYVNSAYIMSDAGKIKILEVIQQGEIGGGESHLLTLIAHIDRHRFEPVVIALSDGEMISRLTASGIRNYVVQTGLPFNISVWGKIREILRKEKIDIVHTHGARALSNLLYPASGIPVPIVHTVHGWSFHDYLPAWKKRLRIAGEKFLTSRASINIAVSESNKRIGLQEFGAFHCEVINNGVDLSLYNRDDKADIRGEFGIAPNAVLISFVARFIHDKNPLALLKAFHRVQDGHPEARLIMVGNGPAREAAITLAAELGMTGKVHFPGFRTDVPDILAASDIFCLPSIKEGLPVSLIEAMASGNAVIATDVQGCNDVVTQGQDGLLVPMEGLEDNLTKALLQLLERPERVRQLAARGRQTVENRFDAGTMAEKIGNLYLRTINPPL